MKVLFFLRISSTMLATKAAILRRSEEGFSKKRQKIQGETFVAESLLSKYAEYIAPKQCHLKRLRHR